MPPRLASPAIGASDPGARDGRRNGLPTGKHDFQTTAKCGAAGEAAVNEQSAAGANRGTDVGAAGENAFLATAVDRVLLAVPPERASAPRLKPIPVLLTVVETASPPAETTRTPPLETTVRETRPPLVTISAAKVAGSASLPASVAEMPMPPERMNSRPPASTVPRISVPPEKTPSWPSVPTKVRLAMPNTASPEPEPPRVPLFSTVAETTRPPAETTSNPMTVVPLALPPLRTDSWAPLLTVPLDIGTAGRHNNLAATTERGADVPASSRNDRMTAVADRGSRSRTAGNYLQKAAAIYGRTEVPAADDDLGAATGDYCIDRRSPRQNLCDIRR